VPVFFFIFIYCYNTYHYYPPHQIYHTMTNNHFIIDQYSKYLSLIAL
jgi:hypothetical protein